ncbi:sensor histidine kinase [Alicyclobacillus macrosporangiidus]|uniref:sensor histidine kinase n=1 Tax=Alicyclobacillus macrosporangiidus TaxID=392015 RepID=UPI0009F80786|nr:HAMP domain-containing sensor histidine kinase [Alicyclobacillus macrosporangiidus]
MLIVRIRDGQRQQNTRVDPGHPTSATPSPQSPDSKKSIVLRVLLSALVFMAVLAVFFLAYFAAAGVYGWLGMQPKAYVVYMTSVIAAWLLLLTTGVVIGKITAPKQHAFWHSLLDAMRQMAKGNFNIHIDVNQVHEPGGGNHPFRQLVHTINNMAKELAQLEAMRQEFISNVSHEIQSPLTSISGFIDVLKNENLSPEQRQHYLSIIEAESKRLSRLGDNLLKLTSLESGYHPFSPERFRLDRQIRNVVLSLEPMWTQKSLEIDLSLPHIEIEADKDLVNHIWINLLSNAIKFTPPQGSIFISAQTMDDKWAEVCVRDTGIGMKNEELVRIFERFYKADKARSGGGSGLGLSIVKKIVDMHHGEIDVESQVGVGTTFAVRLPIRPSESGPS